MPMMQTMVERANEVFSTQNINQVNSALFGPGMDLPGTAQALNIAQTPDEAGVIRAIPESLRNALREVLYTNLSRAAGQKYITQFAWLPSAGYELVVCEAAGQAGSRGGLTIIVKTPNPAPIKA